MLRLLTFNLVDHGDALEMYMGGDVVINVELSAYSKQVVDDVCSRKLKRGFYHIGVKLC